jgi:hypothetical protein
MGDQKEFSLKNKILGGPGVRNFSLKGMTMNYLGPLYFLSNGNWRKNSSRNTRILPHVSSRVFIMLKLKKKNPNQKSTGFRKNNPVLFSALKSLTVHFQTDTYIRRHMQDFRKIHVDFHEKLL